MFPFCLSSLFLCIISIDIMDKLMMSCKINGFEIYYVTK